MHFHVALHPIPKTQVMRLFTLYLLLGVIVLQAQTVSNTTQQLGTALQQQQHELPQEQLYVQGDSRCRWRRK